MYQPAHFREDRLDVQHDLIRTHPLGLLVSAGAGGLAANPIPFVLDAGEKGLGTLMCHVARANPLWSDLAGIEECLVVFQGPDAYVTPSWYPTKRDTGRVVPTWNYAAVHVWGRPEVRQDASWLRRQLDALTGQQERHFPEPWKVSDAPEPYVEAQIRGIVGIEIPIARIEGKWKVSQNRGAADRAGVVSGLRASGDAARAMAQLIVSRGNPPKPES
jgi:transcriptional regulator